MNHDDGLVGVTEASKYLSLSRSALYGLMDRGELDYVKIGRSRRITRQAILELVDRCRVSRQKENLAR